MESFSLNKRQRILEGKADPSPPSRMNDDEVLVAFPPLSPSHSDDAIFSKSLDEFDYGRMQDQAFDILHIFSSSEDEKSSDGECMEENITNTTGDIFLHISKTHASLSPSKDNGVPHDSATVSNHSLNKRKRLSRLEKHISKSLLPPEYHERFKRGFRITMQRDSPLLDYRVWNAMLDDLRVIGFLHVDENDAGTSLSTCDATSCDTKSGNSRDKGDSNEGTMRRVVDCKPLVFTNYCFNSNLYKLILKHLPILFATRLCILRLLAQRVLEVKSEMGSARSMTRRLEYNVPKEFMKQAIQFFETFIAGANAEPREIHEDITRGNTEADRIMPSKQRKRIRLDLSKVGTELLKIKTWQPTLSTTLIPSVLLSCRNLRAISSTKHQDDLSTTACNSLAVNHSSSKALFNLSKRTLKSICLSDIQAYKPLSEYQWENDAKNYLDHNTISKARQSILHMLSANIEVCGHFCIQQLWGTKAKFSFQYESIEKFIDGIESVETKVGEKVVAKQYKEIDASSTQIVKRCEIMHPLKSSPVLPDPVDATEKSIDVYSKYQQKCKPMNLKKGNAIDDHCVNQAVVDQSLPQALTSFELDCDSRSFLTTLSLYPYFLSLSLVMVSFGQLIVPGYIDEFFCCEIAIIVQYMHYKCYLIKALQNAKVEDIPQLRQSKAIFDVIISLSSLSAIVVMNLVVFPMPLKDEEMPYLIWAFICGSVTMCLFCTYHVMITMKVGYQSVANLLFAMVINMTVSPVFSFYGIQFSKPGLTMWAAFCGAFLADVIALIVLCARHKYDFRVSKMSLETYRSQWKDAKKPSRMNACGIFFNCIVVMCSFGWMIQYHTYPDTQSHFFEVLKSKINMRMMIEYGATAIIASLAMYANENHIYRKPQVCVSVKK
eukprot:g9015.t1